MTPSEMMLKVRVGGRNFHTNRLKSLTGIDALENQAKAILSDVHYFGARAEGESATGKATLAIRWRATEFEPMMARLAKVVGIADPIQSYCDVLNHRFQQASKLGRDISTEEAFDDWLASGRPGYPVGWASKTTAD